jgi:hypothetical protein
LWRLHLTVVERAADLPLPLSPLEALEFNSWHRASRTARPDRGAAALPARADEIYTRSGIHGMSMLARTSSESTAPSCHRTA